MENCLLNKCKPFGESIQTRQRHAQPVVRAYLLMISCWPNVMAGTIGVSETRYIVLMSRYEVGPPRSMLCYLAHFINS